MVFNLLFPSQLINAFKYVHYFKKNSPEIEKAYREFNFRMFLLVIYLSARLTFLHIHIILSKEKAVMLNTR